MKSNHFFPQHYASDVIIEIHFVSYEVRTELFNMVYNSYGLQSVKIPFTIIRTGHGVHHSNLGWNAEVLRISISSQEVRGATAPVHNPPTSTDRSLNAWLFHDAVTISGYSVNRKGDW
jgi:hypothetical protein